LEIGTAYGISSIFICEALAGKPNAKHITMDPYQESFFKMNGVHNIKSAGYGDILEFHNDFSYLVLPELIRKGLKVDFIFIDGYHTFDYAFVDFFFADLLLKPNGILVIDDTAWPAVKKAADYVVTNRAYNYIYPKKRNLGQHTWKHNLVMSLMKSLGKEEMIDERIRKYDDYKPALELPLSSRFLAFRKTMEDADFRKEETFHKAF
jgi:predicted O-methyltransferase YrrM